MGIEGWKEGMKETEGRKEDNETTNSECGMNK